MKPETALCMYQKPVALCQDAQNKGPGSYLTVLNTQKLRQLYDAARRWSQHVWSDAGLRQSCETKAKTEAAGAGD